MPEVAASETGRAQTAVRAQRGYGLQLVSEKEQKAMESAAREGERPVREDRRDEQDPEYIETRGILMEVGRTISQG